MSNMSNTTDADEPKALSETRPAWAVLLLVTGILMSMFLIALDRTILSTAIPAITDEFRSLDDIGWYGGAYLLSCCALQLLFGRLCTFFAVRRVLFLSILAFAVASAVCGAARSSTAFIVGRAIAGIGAAGIFAGAMTSMIHVVPLHHKPKLFAAMGSMQTIAQIGGPLIGGAFTTHVSWRWCFYVNLPISGLAMLAVLLFLDIPQPSGFADKPLAWKIRQLDIPGSIFVASGAICILLALQWGGQAYSWNSGRIIALLTVGIACFVAFVVDQLLFPDTATLPSRLLRNRTVVASIFLFVFFTSSNFVIIYFVPSWFQAIARVSATESGIRTIPLMAASVVGLIGGGLLTTVVGYYVPCAVVGACLAAVGAGLIATWPVDAPRRLWIGYQVVNGLGTGLVYQVPNLAIQAVLPKQDAPTGFAVALFAGLLASSIFVAVGESVLLNQLVRRLAQLTATPIDGRLVYASGATALLDQLPADLLPAARVAYCAALQAVFKIGLALACVCVPAACLLEWKSVAPPWAKKVEEEEESEKTAAV